MDYIRSIDKGDAGACFLCDAVNAATPEERRARLVLWHTPLSVVVINRYPYTNGHLLIAPRAHKADFEALTAEELCDLSAQTTAVIRLLKDAMSPQGFNIGVNLGRAAGAGLPGHLHQHVVPRWAGDTNFMPVLADVKVLPEHLSETRAKLAAAWPG
jgi:ATP adenylyltransferase